MTTMHTIPVSDGDDRASMVMEVDREQIEVTFLKEAPGKTPNGESGSLLILREEGRWVVLVFAAGRELPHSEIKFSGESVKMSIL